MDCDVCPKESVVVIKGKPYCAEHAKRFQPGVMALHMEPSNIPNDDLPSMKELIKRFIELPPGPAIAQQPLPVINGDLPIVQDLVMQDLMARKEFGFSKYASYLHPLNGRDALMDAYQEAIDLTMYLRQAIYERDNQ